MKLLLAQCLFTTIAPLVAQASQEPPANEVLDWNRVVAEALAAANTDPLTESRAFAIVQLAVHDALHAVVARSQDRAAADAAVAAAAHDAAIRLVPAARAKLDGELARALRAVPEGDARAQGLEAGRVAAAAVLAARARDGSDRKVEVPPGTAPGAYRPTPPDFTPAWMAQWGDVTPFSLRSGAQFRPQAPLAVDSAEARHDVEQLCRVGGKAQSERNAEHSEIARFWYENSPQGWNRIARVVAQSRQLDVRDCARLFALVNFALADGYIASLDAKYHYGYWRPATAVRAAGNTEWLSYLDTPPIPDYPSAHALVGAAAATVLERFFDNDFVAFETTSGPPYPGITRRYWSFSAAAFENAASRQLCGLHFPTAVRVGLQVGHEVGTWVFEHSLGAGTGAAAADAARR